MKRFVSLNSYWISQFSIVDSMLSIYTNLKNKHQEDVYILQD